MKSAEVTYSSQDTRFLLIASYISGQNSIFEERHGDPPDIELSQALKTACLVVRGKTTSLTPQKLCVVFFSSFFDFLI